MKIIEFNKTGNPADVLRLRQIPDQAPAAGEAKVKVLAAPIHPSNLLQVMGQYAAAPDLPSVPGAEGVGTVIEVGPGVDQVKIGQTVLLLGVGGTWRDEMIVPAAKLLPAPPGDIEQLSMLAVNPLTAHLLLTDFADLKPGDWIIQSAANSAVGELVIQLAARKGLKTVNVVRREDLVQPLKSLGGTVALVDGPDLAERVGKETGGAAIRLALDCVGGDTFGRLSETLGYGAPIVVYGALAGKAPELNIGALISRDLRPRGFWLQKWFETASPEQKQTALAELVSQIAGGQVKTRIDSRFPLEHIADAVNRALSGGRDGKVLLIPNSQ